jgi:hypothetical protein
MAEQNQEVSTDKVLEELGKLDQELQELKTHYDLFFQGVVKVEPQREQKAFQRRLQWFTPAKLKTTGARFKFNNIKARSIQMGNLWRRYLREMEEGTFKRDRFHAKMHAQEQQKPAASTAKTAPQSPSANKAPTKTQQQLDALYNKMKAMSGPDQKVPAKEVFQKAVHAQLKKHKQANPDHRFEINMGKSKSGKVQLSIKGKKK